MNSPKPPPRPVRNYGQQSYATPKKSKRAKSSSGFSQLLIAGAVLLVVGLVGWVGWQIVESRKVPDDGYGMIRDASVQVSLDPDGVVTLGKPGSPIVLDFFEDPLCPICGQFERKFHQTIAKAIDEGRLTVRYHTMAFLDPMSASKNYSSRAAGALQCVAATGDSIGYYTLHSKLYEANTQPAEGGATDLSNETLAVLARANGASDEAVDCTVRASRAPAATEAAEKAQTKLSELNGRGTPSVFRATTDIDVMNNDKWLKNLN